MDYPTTTQPTNGKRNAVLWMASGFVLFAVGTALLGLFVHVILPSPIGNFFLVRWLTVIVAGMGVIGVFLIPVGLVVGLIKLLKF